MRNLFFTLISVSLFLVACESKSGKKLTNSETNATSAITVKLLSSGNVIVLTVSSTQRAMLQKYDTIEVVRNMYAISNDFWLSTHGAITSVNRNVVEVDDMQYHRAVILPTNR